MQKYLNSQPGARESELAERKILRDLEDKGTASLGPIDERLEEVYVQIPVSDGSGWSSTCKLIRPRFPSGSDETQNIQNRDKKEKKKKKKKCPLIVMFHGGGFNRGSPEMYTRPAREFALEFNAVVVCVEYRLAPEHPWPTAVLDAWDICVFLTTCAVNDDDDDDAAVVSSDSSERVDIFGQDVVIDTSGFYLAGASAGANLACAVMSMSMSLALTSTTNTTTPISTTSTLDSIRSILGDRRYDDDDDLKIPVVGIYTGVPFLLCSEIVPSEYKDIFTSRSNNAHHDAVLQACIEAYAPDLFSPLFSPVNLPHETLSRWPPVYIQVGDRDIWRDDAVIVAKILENLGVHVKLDRYPHLAHVTWSTFTTGPDYGIDSELGRKSIAGMRWLIERHTLTTL